MIDGIDELCDVIVRNRARAEATAQLAPEVREAGSRAGLWTLAAPLEVGGAETALPELLATFERLAEADPTVAWHAVNSIPVGIAASRLDPTVSDAIFADEAGPFGYAGAVVTGATAQPTEGGYIVDGSWPFMTGASDATWAALNTPVADPRGAAAAGPPDLRRCIVRLADLEVSDTWTAASGMRGTGSHAVIAQQVFVPLERTFPIGAPSRIDRPLYRVPDIVLFLPPCASMAVGMLRSATLGAIALLQNKVSRFDGHAHFEVARTLQVLADATGVIETLSAGLGRLSDEYWSAIVDGRQPGQALVARLWSTVFYTFDVARKHISNIYAVGTSSTYATQNPIDRALRDVHAVNAAFDSFQSLRLAAGRVLLGREAQHPLFS